jgi:hypothetical protein
MNNYINRFFKEKEIPFQQWEIEDEDGTIHIINNEVIIEHIKTTNGIERKTIENILRKIDFSNGDINHFLKHLAYGLVANYKLGI